MFGFCTFVSDVFVGDVPVYEMVVCVYKHVQLQYMQRYHPSNKYFSFQTD